MANEISLFRTNYFRVKDRVAFDRLLLELESNLKVVEKNGLIALFADDGWPNQRIVNIDTPQEDVVDVDFHAKLATHLADDQIAILIETGFCKAQYGFGIAVALNNRGERVSVNIESIYDLAKTIANGAAVTKAEY